MSAYLITGGSGVGKTTVIAELARRGYQTYTDDDARYAGFYSATGHRLAKSDWPKSHPFDFDRYKWKWHVPALKKLVASHQSTIFYGGVAWNTTACFSLFDAVFVLQPSIQTLKQRLQTRTNNDFGKHPEELASILEQFDPTGDLWRDEGAVVIDANRPIGKITDDILNRIAKKAVA